jgi:putative transposase
MKKFGRPRTVVTDRLRAHSAAMKKVGTASSQEVGGRLNNRAENSHQPFQRESSQCGAFEV